MIVALTLTLDESHRISLLPVDHDSRDWIEDHSIAYNAVCETWFRDLEGKPILLSDDSDMRKMRDDLHAFLSRMFPRIHFVIEARMPRVRTTTEMVTVR
jgi:hypothetical protein